MIPSTISGSAEQQAEERRRRWKGREERKKIEQRGRTGYGNDTMVMGRATHVKAGMTSGDTEIEE